MKTYYFITLAFLATLVVVATGYKTRDTKAGFVWGSPQIQSINALAFGPDGVLFIGDSKSAAVYALDTEDTENNLSAETVEFPKFDEKVAAVLGTSPDKISIQDLVVNPLSKKIYFAVHTENGTPLLFRLDNSEIKPVALKDVSFSTASIENAVAEDAKDSRGRSQRVWTISDLNYDDGKVMISGLSNLEFGSTFRSIPFPFSGQQDHATLEIYHAAHGQYETHAPIKTFTTATIKGEKYLVASYTCTPLVLFPLNELRAGAHVKGRTVAEMGNRNSPLDMISMEKDGKSYLLMANSSRPVMKIKYEDLENFEESLSTPVKENSATAGVSFVSFPISNVLQMDKYDDAQFVLLQRKANGDLDLWTAENNRWL